MPMFGGQGTPADRRIIQPASPQGRTHSAWRCDGTADMLLHLPIMPHDLVLYVDMSRAATTQAQGRGDIDARVLVASLPRVFDCPATQPLHMSVSAFNDPPIRQMVAAGSACMATFGIQPYCRPVQFYRSLHFALGVFLDTYTK